MENGTLSINGIKKEHEGIYQCTVSNDLGTPLKKSASLRVIGEKKYMTIKTFNFCYLYFLKLGHG